MYNTLYHTISDRTVDVAHKSEGGNQSIVATNVGRKDVRQIIVGAAI